MTVDIERYKQLAQQKQGEHRKFLANLKKKHLKIWIELFKIFMPKYFLKSTVQSVPTVVKHWDHSLQKQILPELPTFAHETSSFEDMYLRVDEDGDKVFQSMPCPFLGGDNLCSIYDARPKACREFPHTDRKKIYQINNLTIKIL